MCRWIYGLLAVWGCHLGAAAAEAPVPAFHLLFIATGAHCEPARELQQTWQETCHTSFVRVLTDERGAPQNAAAPSVVHAALAELHRRVGPEDRVMCYVGAEIFDAADDVYVVGSGFSPASAESRKLTGISLRTLRGDLDALPCKVVMLVLEARKQDRTPLGTALGPAHGHATSGAQSRLLWSAAKPETSTKDLLDGALAGTLKERLAEAATKPGSFSLRDLRELTAAAHPTGLFDQAPELELVAPRRSVAVPHFAGDPTGACSEALQSHLQAAPATPGAKRLTFPEHARLDKVMEQLRLNASGLIDPASFNTLKGLTAASHLVVGAVDRDSQTLTVRVVEVATGTDVAQLACQVRFGRRQPADAMPLVAARLVEGLTHFPAPSEWKNLPEIVAEAPAPGRWPMYLPNFRPPTGRDWSAFRVASEYDGMPQVYVPAGRVRLGSEDGPAPERPAVQVQVSAFWMDLHPVTNSQYCAFLNAREHTDEQRQQWVSLAGEEPASVLGPQISKVNGRYRANGNENSPVLYVSWQGARAYGVWAGRELPSEAQWERAARADNDGWQYVWGARGPDEAGRPPANVADSRYHRGKPDDPYFPNYDDGYETTSPVGTYPPNGFGLLDMVGNVWQWCRDTWSPTFLQTLFSQAPGTADPVCLDQGPEASCRGGAWDSGPGECRVGRREHAVREARAYMLGFRCVSTEPAVP